MGTLCGWEVLSARTPLLLALTYPSASQFSTSWGLAVQRSWPLGVGLGTKTGIKDTWKGVAKTS